MAAGEHNLNETGSGSVPEVSQLTTTLIRIFGWGVLLVLVVFLFNNYLTNWLDWPGEGAALGIGVHGSKFQSSVQAWLQLGLYPVGVASTIAYVSFSSARTLRDDSRRISDINVFLIRAAFFAVLYVGAVDAIISFMRVEGFLPAIFGEPLALELGRPHYRGPWVHLPLLAIAFLTAFFTRTLGFTWLALLIVVAELLIVISRFIFSYEQVFMGDLVRFWYAALFLFASAHTLLEEGHVRVDVFYAAFDSRKKGIVNAMGSVFLGLSLCWVILIVGMESKNAVINSPVLVWETTQTGFSMYVKYLMAGFLGLFAVSMMIQFVSFMMEGVADYRGEPGGRDHDVHAIH